MSMRAAPVIASAYREWFDQVGSGSTSHDSVDGYTLAALRAACGGGPVVILEDGTLATLQSSGALITGQWKSSIRVVPVGES